MSMPVIDLDDIDPRDALAAIMASIALQEAAVAHVLNAEGEKIQAVVNLEDATLEDLQGINDSVGALVGNVSSFEGELQRKLRTAMEALYPGQLSEATATITVRLVDENDVPINATGAAFVLINNDDPLDEYYSFVVGSAIRFNNVPPGEYSLQQVTAPPGREIEEFPQDVVVLSDGSVRFNGADVSIHPPSIENPLTAP